MEGGRGGMAAAGASKEAAIEFFTVSIDPSRLSLSPDPTLLSQHRWCPYAHRVWLALEVKRLPYKLVEIDLYGGKPSWFLELNPAGLVPVRPSPCLTPRDDSVVA